MLAHCRAALVSLALLTIVTGLAYPAIVTGIAQVAFPYRANGSLVVKDGKTLGSELIGQPFDDPKYFWGRPSATTPFAYNAGSASGANPSPPKPGPVKAGQARGDAPRAGAPRHPAPLPGRPPPPPGRRAPPPLNPPPPPPPASRA